MKPLDLGKNIMELTDQYPEIIDILAKLGFDEIVKPVMRKTAGRIMTIPKGCDMRGISLEIVKQELEKQGFSIL